MSKVLVLVEGSTEERFVKNILKPHFEPRGIFLTPRNLGGVSKYCIVKSEVDKLMKDPSVALVTTMIDFYRVPSSFPAKDSLQSSMNHLQKAQILEDAFGVDIGSSSFLPYLQLHEFEALLFSDAEKFSKIPNLGNKVNLFHQIANQFESPEEINELPNTAPSKRILQIVNYYQKPLHGILIAQSIGIDKMMEKCQHFNSWILEIERRCCAGVENESFGV